MYVVTIPVRSREIQNNYSKEKSVVTNLLPDREIRDSNSSALVAIYWVLRRQPWKTMAVRTWDTMRRFLLSTLLAASLGALLPPIAHARSNDVPSTQARTYDVLSTNVPFKFKVGDRTFRPGNYQFIFLGPGRLAMRDSNLHIIAAFTTRSRETGDPALVTKLVFSNHKKHSQLTQIWIENRSQVLDVLGEEVALRPTPPSSPLPPMFTPDIYSLFDRGAAPGMKQ